MYRKLILYSSRSKRVTGSVFETGLFSPKDSSVSTSKILAVDMRVVAFSTTTAISKEREEASGPEEVQSTTSEKEQGKSGKESLLDLLGAMKVEVTTKKKFRGLNVQKGKEFSRDAPGALESATSMFQKATSHIESQSVTLSPELVAAASAVASSMPNKRQAESELLQQLRKHESVSDVQKKGQTKNIGNIIADMKIGKRPNIRTSARAANQIHFDDDGRGYIHDRGVNSNLEGVRNRKGLFVGKRLNIFQVPPDTAELEPRDSSPSLWDMELANQIAAVTKHPPRNGFEEMIQWTHDGKLWRYPINNEEGLEEEADIPFHEHVFLEKHLEDFPKQGPIRHFMELVITGLSKNPYLTVRQKTEHIAWFREYFQQKEDLLKEAEVYLN
ncbi:small ribosomal subunit protein mS31 [Lepisosteus oculatus]|uniref:small ribosomal subunit protein mS31 n=1 Tax=Lepisosteus oculatus TaxID=7918 RepID=UPI0037133BEE